MQSYVSSSQAVHRAIPTKHFERDRSTRPKYASGVVSHVSYTDVEITYRLLYQLQVKPRLLTLQPLSSPTLPVCCAKNGQFATRLGRACSWSSTKG